MVQGDKVTLEKVQNSVYMSGRIERPWQPLF